MHRFFLPDYNKSKSRFLIYVLIISFDFIPKSINHYSDYSLLMLLIPLIYLIPVYSIRNRSIKILNKTASLLFLGFILSSISPLLHYGQSVSSTMLSMRLNLLFLYLYLFSLMQPSYSDIYIAIRKVGIFSLILFPILVLFPELYSHDSVQFADFINAKHYNETNDLLPYNPPGFDIVVLLFFMQLQRLLDKFKKGDAFLLLICFIYIVIVQNRSTIIGIVPVLIYGSYKLKFAYKKFWIIILILLGCYLFYDIVNSLLEETSRQLGNDDYNRWQAIDFFIKEWNYNIYSIIFGNGNPTAGSTYLDILMDASKTRFAFISDLGLIGTFFYYGLFLISIIYWFIFKGLLNNKSPQFLKLYSLWLLIVPTIHCLGTIGEVGANMKFVLYFYLVIYFTYHGCFSNNHKLQYKRTD